MQIHKTHTHIIIYNTKEGNKEQNLKFCILFCIKEIPVLSSIALISK